MKEEEIRDPKLLNEFARLAEEDARELFDPSQYEKVPCPSCGNTEYREEFGKHGFQYVSCPQCGTLYVNPRPTQEQLDAFYSTSKSAEFFSKNFIGPYEENRREKIFVPRAEEIVGFFPELAAGRIGDIGAGNGIFLEELRKRCPAAECVAIEPSESAARICSEKGLYVIPKMLEDLIEGEGGFQLLCSFELFEHLYSPRHFLEKIYSLLALGGYLYLTTLNGQGFDIQILWEKHDNVNPPHHLNNEDAVEASESWVHSPQLAAAGPSEYNGTRKDGSHHGGKRIPTCVT